MREKNKSGGRFGRRAVLKSLGTATAIGTLPVVSGKSPGNKPKDFEHTINEANELRKEFSEVQVEKGIEAANEEFADLIDTGPGRGNAHGRDSDDHVENSQEFWKQYLMSKGLGVASQRHQQAFSRGDEDDVSTDAINDVDGKGIDAEISLINQKGLNFDSSDHYVELSFRLWLHDCDFCDRSWGEDPVDTVGIGWDSDCWKWRYENSHSDSMTSSDYTQYEDDACEVHSSFGFEIDDYQLYRDNGPSPDGSYSEREFCGGFLDWTDDCSEDDESSLSAVYSHTWTGNHPTWGVSVSTFGVPSASISYSSSVEEEQTDTENDNDTPLRIEKQEAETKYY